MKLFISNKARNNHPKKQYPLVFTGKGADAIQSGPASDEENEDTLCHWAVRVLRTADPAEKV